MRAYFSGILFNTFKMSLDWWNYLLIALFSIAGGYIGAYLRKKGELKAINEEYEDILVQIKEQTKETENIKNNGSYPKRVGKKGLTF